MNYYLTSYNDNSLDISVSFKEYLKQIANFPILSQEEETRYLENFHNNGDKEAAKILVTSHLRLVAKIAYYYKYKGCELPIMDLVSEGTLGLIEAIKKFDFQKQCRLATYAAYHIKAKIYDFIMESFSIVKLGTGKVMKGLFNKYKELLNSNSDEEIQCLADDLDTNTAKVHDIKSRFELRDWSLNNKMNDENHNSSEFIDTIVCERDNPEETILEAEHKFKYLYAIRKACDAVLTEEERGIIYHRIISEDPLTLREVGNIYNMTAEAVRQKQEKALRKVRIFMNNSGLTYNKRKELSYIK